MSTAWTKSKEYSSIGWEKTKEYSSIAFKKVKDLTLYCYDKIASIFRGNKDKNELKEYRVIENKNKSNLEYNFKEKQNSIYHSENIIKKTMRHKVASEGLHV